MASLRFSTRARECIAWGMVNKTQHKTLIGYETLTRRVVMNIGETLQQGLPCNKEEAYTNDLYLGLLDDKAILHQLADVLAGVGHRDLVDLRREYGMY